jgi:hypothetical protein
MSEPRRFCCQECAEQALWALVRRIESQIKWAENYAKEHKEHVVTVGEAAAPVLTYRDNLRGILRDARPPVRDKS